MFLSNDQRHGDDDEEQNNKKRGQHDSIIP